MHKRLSALVLPLAVGLTFLVWTGSALADTTPISGTLPNPGCSRTYNVVLNGPSRIDVAVSTTAASNKYWTEIIDPSGNVVSANGYADTTGSGNYQVRICSSGEPYDPNPLQYSGLIATGPPGQSALPPQQAQYSFGVLGKTTTVTSKIVGHGAILTKHGLAWVTVRANDRGQVRVRVDSVGGRVHLNYTSGMRAVFGASTVRITGHSLALTFVERGSNDRIAIKSSRLKASGRVVRGGFQLSI